MGTRRFYEFKSALGIGRNILTNHLAELVDQGLLTRVPYQERPLRHEYRLTDKGRDVYPILTAMAAWADKWLTGPEGTPLVFHHVACGHDMAAEVVCNQCHQPIDVRQTTGKPGPGFPSKTRTASHSDDNVRLTFTSVQRSRPRVAGERGWSRGKRMTWIG